MTQKSISKAPVCHYKVQIREKQVLYYFSSVFGHCVGETVCFGGKVLVGFQFLVKMLRDDVGRV